jgi:hypothetical protein
VLVVFFLAGCVALYLRVGTTSENDWSKYIKIFDALGPLVGLAVGWTFGKEVHRKEAENAATRANEARQDAERAHKRADALAGAILTMKTHAENANGATGDASGNNAVSHLQSLADVAAEIIHGPPEPIPSSR